MISRDFCRWLGCGLLALCVLQPISHAARSTEAANSLFAQAFDLLSSGHAAEAISKFQAGLQLNPNDGRAHFFLASAFLARGEKGKAVIELNRCLSLEPKGEYSEKARAQLAVLANRRPADEDVLPRSLPLVLPFNLDDQLRKVIESSQAFKTWPVASRANSNTETSSGDNNFRAIWRLGVAIEPIDNAGSISRVRTRATFGRWFATNNGDGGVSEYVTYTIFGGLIGKLAAIEGDYFAPKCASMDECLGELKSDNFYQKLNVLPIVPMTEISGSLYPPKVGATMIIRYKNDVHKDCEISSEISSKTLGFTDEFAVFEVNCKSSNSSSSIVKDFLLAPYGLMLSAITQYSKFDKSTMSWTAKFPKIGEESNCGNGPPCKFAKFDFNLRN